MCFVLTTRLAQGTIWTVSVDSTSTFLVSGSADNQLRLWRVSTGECLKVWEFPTAIKRAAFSEDDSKVLACTEARMGYSGRIVIMDVNSENEGKSQADEPALSIDCSRSKAAVASWSALDKYIISAHEDGSICQWDPKDGELVNRVPNIHEATVMDMQMSQDRTYCLTASRDKTAKACYGPCIHLISDLQSADSSSTARASKSSKHTLPLLRSTALLSYRRSHTCCLEVVRMP